ncbi:hypothetical protein AGOR_G00187260 [Albula goreensis]|uniref:Ubiquitin-like domain-containing protein n=1 Tax=Albula goreensis TaxID=1534307 RepID=A0A8T3CTU0_9TELE|nr:hypothetical protein AGOR_G00187260 [Albula goreensis]
MVDMCRFPEITHPAPAARLQKEQAAQQSSALGESRKKTGVSRKHSPGAVNRRTPAQGPAAPRRMGKLYQVIVNGLKGEKMTVDLGHSESEMGSMTVLQLKQKIAEKLPGNSGDNLESIRLIFTTKQLEDSSKLSEYSIQDKSVIQMVLRLPGGQQD